MWRRRAGVGWWVADGAKPPGFQSGGRRGRFFYVAARKCAGRAFLTCGMVEHLDLAKLPFFSDANARDLVLSFICCPLPRCSLVQCGVMCRVRESQTHSRARSLILFGFTNNLKLRSYGQGNVNSKKWDRLRGGIFCFSLTRGRACGRQQRNTKTNTEHERLQFWGTTEHERGLTRTPHGALKCTKTRTRTEKTLYTIHGCTIVHLMQISDSGPFGVMY